MKKVIWVLYCLIACQTMYGQFYLRGEVRDDRGHLLEGVKIHLSSQGSFPYFSGTGGTFGIPSRLSIDTITLNMDGYETVKATVDTRQFHLLVLKMLPSTAHLYTGKLSSATTNLRSQTGNSFAALGESYNSLKENEFVDAWHYPETGFALNVDKASYSNIRRFLSNEMMVPVDAIRIEEMLNYFDLNKSSSASSSNTFDCKPLLSNCPWNNQDKLLFLHVAAPKLCLDSIPQSNLVFLIDVSGSMDKPNRLPLLQSAFKLLVDHLREKDTVSIITYGGGIRVIAAPTGGNEKKKIKDAIDSLTASGDTPGEGAIRIAYDLVKKNFLRKGNNRVILATDGDFNIGQTSDKELEDMIIAYKQTGIYLTCLGVGMGNYKDSKLEALSKKGNGNFAYLDNLQEAEKVLVKEFTQTIYTVANNAHLKINFNPAIVKEYRLIGFDNKQNAIADSSSELEGGEVGSGHSTMAVFEIKPAENDSELLQQQLALVSLQYLLPGKEESRLQNFIIPYTPVDLQAADSSYRFAAAVTMFGSLLKKSVYAKNYDFEEVLRIARSGADLNEFHQKELIGLIEKAIKIYEPAKKKKRTAN